LKDEIDDLADKGLLPPVMKEWSHEVRILGNENAHPTPGGKGTNQRDANDVVEFLTMLLTMTYDLPHQIGEYRKRRAEQQNKLVTPRPPGLITKGTEMRLVTLPEPDVVAGAVGKRGRR
jgi:hypothetical protein